MNTPNIFNYATNELSQDAIICYILEWAKVENKELNSNLHSLAIEFLNSLFNKFDTLSKPTKYEKIEIFKQYKNIDILCIINDKYSIIIEYKTNTKNHSNQLQRYFNIIKKPRIVRAGKSSTVGILENEFRITDNKNIIDINKTIDFIKEVQTIQQQKFMSINK